MIANTSGIKGYTPLTAAALNRSMIGYQIESIIPTGTNALAFRAKDIDFGEGDRGDLCFLGVILLQVTSTGPDATYAHIQCQSVSVTSGDNAVRQKINKIGDDFAANGVYAHSTSSNANYIKLLEGDSMLGKFETISIYEPTSGAAIWKFLIGIR